MVTRAIGAWAAACAWALAGAALAQSATDPIRAPIEHARKLAAEGRYHDALRALASIDATRLEAGPALELETLTRDIEAKKAAKLAEDKAAAKSLEIEGRFEDAAARLGGIARYGSPEDAAWAETEQKRLREAGAKAAEEAAVRAEAEKAARAEQQKRDAERLKAKVGAWLNKRRQLYCSTCAGSGKATCGVCGGSGKVRVIDAASTTIGGTRSYRLEPCNNLSCRGGRVDCRACQGAMFNAIALEDVLYETYAPSTRCALEREFGSGKQFAAALMARHSGRAGANTTPTLEECYRDIGAACDPIVGRERIEVEFDPSDPDLARCRYKCKYKGGEVRVEETRWRRMDAGDWFIDPPHELRKSATTPSDAPPKTNPER